MSEVVYHGWTHRPKAYGGTDPIPPSGLAIFAIKVFEDTVETVVGDGAFEWDIPEDLDGAALVKVEAYVTTVGSSTTTISIRNNTQALEMLSTNITIESGELNSVDAATQPVVNAGNAEVVRADELSINVDAAGTGSLGLGVYLYFAPLTTSQITLAGAEGAPGAPGAPGGITAWTGEWDSGTAYSTNESVSNNGSSYAAVTGSTNVEPGVDVGWESSWQLLADSPATAADVPIVDSGGYYTATEVEAVLQEVGLQLTGSATTDGWVGDVATWTYASATTFTVSGDVTAQFGKGTRLKLTQTTVKYFVVTNSVFSAGTTTVTITGGTDYTLANASIDDPLYSYQANPQGYPGTFTWSPTLVGWSSPSIAVANFSVVGNKVTLNLAVSGTSNSSTTTYTVPITPLSNPSVPFCPIMIRNNGNYAIGRHGSSVSGSTITCGLSATSDSWTASGTKELYVQGVIYTI